MSLGRTMSLMLLSMLTVSSMVMSKECSKLWFKACRHPATLPSRYRARFLSTRPCHLNRGDNGKCIWAWGGKWAKMTDCNCHIEGCCAPSDQLEQWTNATMTTPTATMTTMTATTTTTLTARMTSTTSTSSTSAAAATTTMTSTTATMTAMTATMTTTTTTKTLGKTSSMEPTLDNDHYSARGFAEGPASLLARRMCENTNITMARVHNVYSQPPKIDQYRENCEMDRNLYCSPRFESRRGEKHTLCTRCGVHVANCYNRVCYRGIDQKTIAVIVSEHNRLRSRVALGLERRGSPGPQPKASSMFALQWDPKLARIAQRWADQCEEYHDHSRSTIEFDWVGQNLYDSWSSHFRSTLDVRAMIKGWYDEVQHWPSVNIPKYSRRRPKVVKAKTGHYTALVWAKTKKVGCGIIAYYDNDPAVSRHPYRQTFVCNYGPGGNVLGRPVYKVTNGKAGNGCPRKVRNGLCL